MPWWLRWGVTLRRRVNARAHSRSTKTRRRDWLVVLASRLGVRPREMRALLEARAPYLDAAFTAMEERHGSIEAYLCDALGVTDELRARLRAALLV